MESLPRVSEGRKRMTSVVIITQSYQFCTSIGIPISSTWTIE
ncbi:MAG: hypothetical protein ACTSRP_23850 [Candidatus Helarchaeota archaeon]